MDRQRLLSRPHTGYCPLPCLVHLGATAGGAAPTRCRAHQRLLQRQRYRTGCNDDEQTYAATAAALRPFARNVIVIEDEEGMEAQPVDCLLAAGATLSSCMTTQTSTGLAFNDGLTQLAKAKHFSFLKTRGWFCYQNQCPMVVGTTVVYRDMNHLTVEYAQRLTGPFRVAFRQCIFATCPR